MSQWKNVPLHIVSDDDWEKRFRLEEQQFAALRDLLGDISDEARTTLETHVAQFMRQFRLNEKNQTWGDVEDHLAPWKDASRALRRIARRGSSDDAKSVLMEMLREAFLANEVSVTDLLYIDGKKLSEQYQLPSTITLRLSREALRRVELDFDRALREVSDKIAAKASRTAKDLRSMPKQDVERRFLLILAGWSEKQGFVHGAYETFSRRNEGSGATQPPTRFAHFAAALLQMLPPQFRKKNRRYDAKAVASRLKEALEQRKTIEKAKIGGKDAKTER